MDYRNCRRLRKFYGQQVTQVSRLLDRFVRQSSEIDIDKYLKICEQIGETPDPKKMPLTASDFPEEVQVAFFVFSFLPDRWDGMSGSYLGKDWSEVEYLFKLYEIENPKIVYYFAKIYERAIISFRAEEADKRRKAEERKAKAGGKNFTHNVTG